jgi:transcriptional regulator with XRE-family HTH domain
MVGYTARAMLVKCRPMPKKITFTPPHRMRELRLREGLSLEALAERMGGTITVTQLSRIERGQNQMTHQRLSQVADALGVHPADILGHDDGGLSPIERDLVHTYRHVPASLRAGFDALREAGHAYVTRAEPPPDDAPE